MIRLTDQSRTSGAAAPGPGRTVRRWLLLASVLLAGLVPARRAESACVCGTGKMLNYFSTPTPSTAPISIDGEMGDWTAIMASPNNNICDGYPGGITDLDGNIQSTGRDLMQFTYTYDNYYVYAYTQRYASSTNTDNFIYYADTNNNGVMETGEPVIVVAWQGSNRTVGVYVGTYHSYYASGDPMTCTAGYTAGQSCTSGYADGYHLPGTIVNLPAGGHPNYSGQWGSATGTEMEWRVSWDDLGLSASPGTPFTFHVSSTNSQPGAGSFPAQVDDNMGGCGGKGGTTQYAGIGLTPTDTLVPLSTTTVYTTTHTLTNTGNGNDNFTLQTTATGPNNPSVSVVNTYNGKAFTDTSTLGAGFYLAPGQSITFTTTYTFSSSPSGKSYTAVTKATSKFDATQSAQATDSLTSQEAVTLTLDTGTVYGSFNFTGGTNSLGGSSGSVTLTTSAGTSPVTSPGYTVNPSQPAQITENVTAGWVYDHGTCSYLSTNTALAAGTYSFVTNSNGTVTLTLQKTAFTGDNINCTFYNKRLPIVTVTKMFGAPRISDSDQFRLELWSGGSLVSSANTSGSGESITSGTAGDGTGTFTYTAAGAGVTYSLGETKISGPTAASVYTVSSVNCTNHGNTVSSIQGLGDTFTSTMGDRYSCYITNTPQPTLQINKISDLGSAPPGQVVTYTNQVSNLAGAATSVVLTDALSHYTALRLNYNDVGPGPFSFLDGSIPSGLQLGTPVYSNDNGASWGYSLVSGAGGAPAGYDAAVTNWKIPMTGAMSGSNGSPPYPGFSVKYQVITR